MSSSSSSSSATVEKTTTTVRRVFRTPFLSEEARETLVEKVNRKIAESGSEATPIGSIETEQCFNIELAVSETGGGVSAEKMAILEWLLRETYEPELFGETTSLT